MKWLWVALVIATASCTLGARGRDPSAARSPDDPEMPSEVLQRSNPAADTSKNPVLSRSEANPHPWLSSLFSGCGPHPQDWGGHETPIGCGGCSSRDVSGAGTTVLVALAALVTTRRRRRS